MGARARIHLRGSGLEYRARSASFTWRHVTLRCVSVSFAASQSELDARQAETAQKQQLAIQQVARILGRALVPLVIAWVACVNLFCSVTNACWLAPLRFYACLSNPTRVFDFVSRMFNACSLFTHFSRFVGFDAGYFSRCGMSARR